MGLREVKAKLKTLNKDEIISLIGELYKKNKAVKEHLDYWVEPNELELHKKYRQKVIETFFPKQGYTVRLKEGKKAITDYKKLNPRPLLIADLMLSYVEVGVEYSVEIADFHYDSKNLSSIHSVLYDVLIYASKNNLIEIFRERFEELVIRSDKLGIFFHEVTMNMLYDFIPDLLDEEEDHDEEELEHKAIIFELPKK